LGCGRPLHRCEMYSHQPRKCSHSKWSQALEYMRRLSEVS
jgi:hypothetical protein